MTGNIAFLGMGIAGDISAPSLVAVLTSMAGFAIGVCLATRMVNVLLPIRDARWRAHSHRVAGSARHLLSASRCWAHLCFVVTWLAIGGRPGEGDTLVLLAAWALAMGIQSVAVRQLDVSGVFTTAATATFIFLCRRCWPGIGSGHGRRAAADCWACFSACSSAPQPARFSLFTRRATRLCFRSLSLSAWWRRRPRISTSRVSCLMLASISPAEAPKQVVPTTSQRWQASQVSEPTCADS